jgi:hypothetical protein
LGLGADTLRRACLDTAAVATGSDEDVDDLPVLADGPVGVAPDTVDVEVGLVDKPPIARTMLSEAGRVGEQGVNR